MYALNEIDDNRNPAWNMDRFLLSRHRSRELSRPVFLASAERMKRAADTQSPPFLVSGKDILDHMVRCDQIVFGLGVLPESCTFQTLGFLSMTGPFDIEGVKGSPVRARYIRGAIVAPEVGGHGLMKSMLAHAAAEVDAVVLHTQNPRVYRAMAGCGLFEVVFPVPDHSFSISPGAVESICRSLSRFSRGMPFDSRGGVVQDLYGRPLYPIRPLHRDTATNNLFAALSPGDGVAVIGFKDRSQAERASILGPIGT